MSSKVRQDRVAQTVGQGKTVWVPESQDHGNMLTVGDSVLLGCLSPSYFVSPPCTRDFSHCYDKISNKYSLRKEGLFLSTAPGYRASEQERTVSRV